MYSRVLHDIPRTYLWHPSFAQVRTLDLNCIAISVSNTTFATPSDSVLVRNAKKWLASGRGRDLSIPYGMPVHYYLPSDENFKCPTAARVQVEIKIY